MMCQNNLFRSVLCEKSLSIMSECRFLETEIEVVGRTVSLLTASILFPLVAIGSYKQDWNVVLEDIFAGPMKGLRSWFKGLEN